MKNKKTTATEVAISRMRKARELLREAGRLLQSDTTLRRSGPTARHCYDIIGAIDGAIAGKPRLAHIVSMIDVAGSTLRGILDSVDLGQP